MIILFDSAPLNKSSSPNKNLPLIEYKNNVLEFVTEFTRNPVADEDFPLTWHEVVKDSKFSFRVISVYNCKSYKLRSH